MHRRNGGILAGILGFFISWNGGAWAQSSSPSFKMEGEAALLSNFVQYGVTQTDADPSLQGSFWFNFGPQFRMGLWGSNVAYEGSDSHFWLKAMAELKVELSSNADFTLRFADSRFFKPETRSGTVGGVTINMFGYKVIIESNDNFLGSEESITYFAFAKAWDLGSGWKWDNQVGYIQSDGEIYQTYFDARSFVGIKPSNILYQGGVTATSSPGQFSGKGDVFLVLSATTSF